MPPGNQKKVTFEDFKTFSDFTLQVTVLTMWLISIRDI